ncbi:MAG TPA: hypothetical protein VGR10_03855 [Thermoleophilaceae bacterium]|nr:hypothetical protein [Thermoleophilaceae bacterium]
MRFALPLLMVLAALGTGLLTACGEEEDAQAIIEEAFRQPIESADVSLALDLELEGEEAPAEPIRVQVTGPYVSGGRERIPSLDLDVSLQGGGGQIPPFGLISTGDNVFVEVAGSAYEVGEQAVAEQNRLLEEQSGEEAGFAALGIEPREWIADAEVEGEEEVAGVTATHVSAGVDVPALLEDLGEAAERAQELGGEPVPALTEEERAQLAEAIEDPRFDLFVDDERRVRRLTAALSLRPPDDGSAPEGFEGGVLSFEIELANLDEGQAEKIQPPPSPRPLSDLLQQLGGLGGDLEALPPGAVPEGSVPGGGSSGSQP